MSTHVVGFIPPDETWQKMLAVWDACSKAGVRPPGEVEKFFGDSDPKGIGRQVEIPHREYSAKMVSGVEVEIDKLPKEVKFIRFYNSY